MAENDKSNDDNISKVLKAFANKKNSKKKEQKFEEKEEEGSVYTYFDESSPRWQAGRGFLAFAPKFIFKPSSEKDKSNRMVMVWDLLDGKPFGISHECCVREEQRKSSYVKRAYRYLI